MPDLDSLHAAMATEAAADALKFDGVRPETMVMLVESQRPLMEVSFGQEPTEDSMFVIVIHRIHDPKRFQVATWSMMPERTATVSFERANEYPQ